MFTSRYFVQVLAHMQTHIFLTQERLNPGEQVWLSYIMYYVKNNWTLATICMQPNLHILRQWNHSVVQFSANVVCLLEVLRIWEKTWVSWPMILITYTLLGIVPFLCPTATTCMCIKNFMLKNLRLWCACLLQGFSKTRYLQQTNENGTVSLCSDTVDLKTYTWISFRMLQTEKSCQQSLQKVF